MELCATEWVAVLAGVVGTAMPLPLVALPVAALVYAMTYALLYYGTLWNLRNLPEPAERVI